MKAIYKSCTVSFILLISVLTAFHSSAFISGRLEGAEKKGIKIYLLQPATLREVAASYLGKVIDSAVVSAEGSFTFRNPPDTREPVLLELAVQLSGKAANYLQTD